MLARLFSAILNMSLTGSIVIGCVLLARLALRRAPRVFSYALWAVVLFRLLCPVSVSSPVSVLNLAPVPEPVAMVDSVEYVPVIREPAPVRTTEAQEPEPQATRIDWRGAASLVWVCGVGAMTAYGIFGYLRLKNRLRIWAHVEKGVRAADDISSPFVLGLVRPMIYLPSGLSEQQRAHILLHERHHIRRGDHIVKFLGICALCLHWFNPLVWLAFTLADRDMEMSCDEAVLRRLGPEIRADYAQSLLDLATGRRAAIAPLAFGEGDTGDRVRHVLGWKMAARWMLPAGTAVCLLVLLVTMLNPQQALNTGADIFGANYRALAALHPEGISPSRLYVLGVSGNLQLRDGEERTDLGVLEPKQLGWGFDLSDELTEWKLRWDNDGAWTLENESRWLLLQKDGRLYLTEGDGNVILLERAAFMGSYDTRQLRDWQEVHTQKEPSAVTAPPATEPKETTVPTESTPSPVLSISPDAIPVEPTLPTEVVIPDGKGPWLQSGWYAVREDSLDALTTGVLRIWVRLDPDGTGELRINSDSFALKWDADSLLMTHGSWDRGDQVIEEHYADLLIHGVPHEYGLALFLVRSRLLFDYTGDALPESYLEPPVEPGLYGYADHLCWTGKQYAYGEPLTDGDMELGWLELKEDGTGTLSYGGVNRDFTWVGDYLYTDDAVIHAQAWMELMYYDYIGSLRADNEPGIMLKLEEEETFLYLRRIADE